ncbi:MAG: MBL fold metallo-hydrolase [Propionibacteriales bacterium]|nr:MBL fold metallo-hydrolase [Propionibacteriales bacterium]
MKLTIVGMSGSYPGPDSAASCYLVEQEHEGRTHRLVLDLGSGALGQLQRYTRLDEIDAVLLSHLHADHCLDLCGFYVVRRYYCEKSLPRVPVYGPRGTAGRLARAYGLPLHPGMTTEFDFRSYPDGRFSLGPFSIRRTRVRHPVPAYAVRIEAGGSSLVYSGDTGACGSLVRLAAGCDLFLCEGSFVESADNPPDLHMTGKEAAEHASRAGVGRLVLTHIPPTVDQMEVLADAKPAYAGPLDVARPGATYTL